ncbi:MAG: RecX family transcriptional regulator [Nitrospiraceae bacterium]|nr:MAG: RecX family transcriptional regulator [Nitrospiraceae bacterium]
MKGPRNEARAYALKLLSYRSRSRKEMLNRLRGKGFDTARIDDTIHFLESARLIDDSALADDLAKYALEKKHLGKRGIGMYLARRGIDRELADRALSLLAEDTEEEAARAIALKKLRTLQDCQGDVVKRRLLDTLRRRGFSGALIRKLMKELLS